MRRRSLGRRMLTGAAVAGLMTAGLLPLPLAVPAQAAPVTAAADVNLALGRPATAGGSHGAYPAGNATDGQQATYWEGPAGTFPEWLQVDLGTARDVDRVVLKLPAAWESRTQTLSVRGSTDGATFHTLDASRGRAFGPAQAGTVAVGLDSPAEARYVRVEITGNTGWNAAQLAELEVYGDDADTGPPPAGTNLARNKPAEATSTTQNYVAANATDDSTSTYWEAAGNPADLTVKLGADADISGVVVKLNPDPAWSARTQSIQVLGRARGESGFTSLRDRADYAFSPGRDNAVTIPAGGRVSDVRLRFFSNSGAPGGQVAEFQVLGTAAPAPDLTVTGLDWSPAAPNERDEVTVNATVRNAGTAASAATTTDVTVEGRQAGSAAVPALDPGESAEVAVATGTHAAGSYAVAAVVDPRDTVAELDDTNNSRAATDRIVVDRAPGPDLEVRSLTTDPAHPAVGAEVSFTVAVHNRGTSDAPAGTVTRVQAGTTTLDGTTGRIAAGATVNVPIAGTWKAAGGGVTLTATADATDLVAETNENNNVLAQSLVVGRGAAVPYTEYEAEDGRYDGTLLTTDAKRTFGHTNFGTESSGRKSVRLDTTGQYVAFTSTTPTNSVVVRNSIPDAPGGGGTEATLSLYADGVFVQKLTLSSKHSWLYGSTDDPEGLTNRPGGDARRLFDESHALLDRTFPRGTEFRLQRDAGDSAAFYVIDLIDLEQVAPAKTKPAECTSITEYGAVPGDGLDDTDAIQRAVTDNQNGRIDCVWIPAGQWRQEQKILTDDPQNRGQYNQVGIRDVTVRGAGMWHSQLYTLTPPHEAGGINHPHEGNFGFDVDDNTQISDLAIFGSGTLRGGDGNQEGGVGLNGRFGKNTKISNVWIEHANVGVWVGRDYSNIPELW
ncbi:CARDB domain-containing protein, partial [Streptomyces ardesiacus]|uniref:CARDB domain-containing protein n=1 Tax=Streptomyces ardesiacus TaxID=285564 RepID=UPI00363A2F2C